MNKAQEIHKELLESAPNIEEWVDIYLKPQFLEYRTMNITVDLQEPSILALNLTFREFIDGLNKCGFAINAEAVNYWNDEKPSDFSGYLEIIIPPGED